MKKVIKIKASGFLLVVTLLSSMLMNIAIPKKPAAGSILSVSTDIHKIADTRRTADTRMMDMSALLLSEALTHIGKKYVFGGCGPGRFDCSGYVEYCYKTALGITPPRIIGGHGGGSQYQYNGCIKIDESEVFPGDLVFFGKSKNHISHVGIYVSKDRMINAANERDGVCYKTISKFIPRFVAYGRVIGFGEQHVGKEQDKEQKIEDPASALPPVPEEYVWYIR